MERTGKAAENGRSENCNSGVKGRRLGVYWLEAGSQMELPDIRRQEPSNAKASELPKHRRPSRGSLRERSSSLGGILSRPSGYADRRGKRSGPSTWGERFSLQPPRRRVSRNRPLRQPHLQACRLQGLLAGGAAIVPRPSPGREAAHKVRVHTTGCLSPSISTTRMGT
jgi:hypothetical protein